MLKLALIREGKQPNDRRVALTPAQAKKLSHAYAQVQVVVQKSAARCYPDHEYSEAGIAVQEQVNDCDILLGIKEVPVQQLIDGKTYLFFSHTIKKQPYNRKMLQEILKKNIRLIDYEKLTDENGNRLVGFGRWAGIVGAYNGIWAWGKRFNLFDLHRASNCFNLEELQKEYSKVKLPPIKIAVTGAGRVAGGAIEVLKGMKIRQVEPAAFIDNEFQEAVFTQLRSQDYHLRRDGGDYNREEYHQNPWLYDADFAKYTRVTDLLIAAAYWNPKAPVLFSREEIKKEDFKIKVIADVTCDIEGSVPCTLKASTIAEPLYDYDPAKEAVTTPLSDPANLTIMAIDNLPCELPRDASENFGKQLMEHVLPYLLGEDSRNIIKRATITDNGKLCPGYEYLQSYVNEQD
ncbi:NAD(P)-dependent oxidoreductase [Nafulsella turpanensis]|uniref:NAD(P)-dependent oxidoreductase n=1 Tax=Nafulsella turpanensis TaxID=1265690 RepID=UPI000477501E|nr:NAD(P)-dependent oxidoreductase [Nafulsella turpanensis]